MSHSEAFGEARFANRPAGKSSGRKIAADRKLELTNSEGSYYAVGRNSGRARAAAGGRKALGGGDRASGQAKAEYSRAGSHGANFLPWAFSGPRRSEPTSFRTCRGYHGAHSLVILSAAKDPFRFARLNSAKHPSRAGKQLVSPINKTNAEILRCAQADSE